MRALKAPNSSNMAADFQAAREEAQRLSLSRGLHMVPSFHRDLALGVGTYALEMFTERPDLDVLYVPIGVGSDLRLHRRARCAGLKTEIVGVQAARGRPPLRCPSRLAGRFSTERERHARRRHGDRAVPDEEALEIIGARRALADRAGQSIEEIAEAVRVYSTDTHNLAEGAGRWCCLRPPGRRAMPRQASRRAGSSSGGPIDPSILDLLPATADRDARRRRDQAWRSDRQQRPR